MSFCWGRQVSHKLESKDSPLDTEITTGVFKAVKKGTVCRNNPLTVRRRRLEGVMSIVVQNAIDLFVNPREVGEKGEQVMKEPDPEAFNYARAAADERVTVVSLSLEGRFTGIPVSVFASVNPIVRIHAKVVPKCDSLLPQHMTEDLLLYGLCILEKSTRTDMRLVFDSLATRPLINHFHYDAFYLGSTGLTKSRFPIEGVERAIVSGDLTTGNVSIELLQEMQWLTRGFVVSAGGKKDDKSLFCRGDIEPLARVSASLIAELQRRNIPHTVIICPAIEARLPKKMTPEKALSGQVEGIQFPMTPEVYILPRSHEDAARPGMLGIELAGLVMARTEELYSGITEADLKGYIGANVTCKDKVFDEILCKAAWLSN